MLKLSKKESLLASIFLLGIITLISIDVYDDIQHGSNIWHAINEILIILFNIICFGYLWYMYFLTQNENKNIRINLQKLENDLSSYKKETEHLLKGLSEKIDHQLNKWNLTKSEKEIALLLLKGLSTKEISSIRETSENTIKQQCNSIYQKSNLAGRTELSAFFLEDLFIL